MEYRIVNDTQLYHYGVPGMKWGVRHDRPSSGDRKAAKVAYKNANMMSYKKNVDVYNKSIVADQKKRNAKKIGLYENARRQRMGSHLYRASNRSARLSNKAAMYKKLGNESKAAKFTKKANRAKQKESVIRSNVSKSKKGYDVASKGERVVASLTNNSTAYYVNRANNVSKGKAAARAAIKGAATGWYINEYMAVRNKRTA